ncbi:MAG: hypothetical protein JRN21_00400 [Nitrososphaerota archaeon]|nr:hypothetical protein [Nitrososphaerota archaeon]
MMETAITAGIDVGTRNTKVALLEDGKRILTMKDYPTGYDFGKAAEQALHGSLDSLGLGRKDVSYVAATGFGRYRVDFRDINVTDITANGKGAKFLYPNTTCVLDVGAGNARASKVNENGKVIKFRSTEKCAAGGGGFLEKISFYTGVKLSELGEVSLKALNPVNMSTVCSVLAESEVINLVTQEVPMEDILMGAHNSVAGRVSLTLKQVGLESEITLTGGLVLNPAFIKALEEKIHMKVNASSRLLYAGALGAAYLGYKRLEKKTQAG